MRAAVRAMKNERAAILDDIMAARAYLYSPEVWDLPEAQMVKEHLRALERDLSELDRGIKVLSPYLPRPSEVKTG